MKVTNSAALSWSVPCKLTYIALPVSLKPDLPELFYFTPILNKIDQNKAPKFVVRQAQKQVQMTVSPEKASTLAEKACTTYIPNDYLHVWLLNE